MKLLIYLFLFMAIVGFYSVEKQEDVHIDPSIVIGSWELKERRYSKDDEPISQAIVDELNINGDNTYSSNLYAGSWKLEGNDLHLFADNQSKYPYKVYKVKYFADDQLVLESASYIPYVAASTTIHTEVKSTIIESYNRK